MNPSEAQEGNRPSSGAIQSALDSIRVVELTEALAGPRCAMLLGDPGAEVVKVGRPQKDCAAFRCLITFANLPDHKFLYKEIFISRAIT
jgi:crotonobetainyl-CoA:carnitine CoA-transferase CaiB-like acyl-CoA transferase